MSLLAEDTEVADLGLRWKPGFSTLGPAFLTELRPTPLPDPYWVGRSDAVARELGLPADWHASATTLAALTGSLPSRRHPPFATVYSGHQFGVWAGQLGDGRAIMIGETEAGLGPRAATQGRGPHALLARRRRPRRAALEHPRIPLQRGDARPRHSDHPRAVRDRLRRPRAARRTRKRGGRRARGAQLHPLRPLRALRGQPARDELRALADYVIDRYYPACRTTERFGGNAYAAFLEAVSERTAALLAQWQAVGFCHGVMNTDNMSILGLTIDYGPFQFLDGFDPRHICNHSDTSGPLRLQPAAQRGVLEPVLPGAGAAAADRRPGGGRGRAGVVQDRVPHEFEGRMRAKLGLADPPKATAR
jgi:hypothetical protein